MNDSYWMLANLSARIDCGHGVAWKRVAGFYETGKTRVFFRTSFGNQQILFG